MSKRILIVGAGGHAQVVADILLQMHEHDPSWQLVGYLDDNMDLWGKSLLGSCVLGNIAVSQSVPHDALVIAVGNNEKRAWLFEKLRRRGEEFIAVSHPRAILSPHLEIGDGTMTCAGAVVNPASFIGENTILNTGCTVDHHNRIGPHVHIGPGAHLGGEAIIETGALIGIGATVLPGRRVGAWSVVGAGAVVCEDVPGGATVVGVPARQIERVRA